MLDYFTDHRKSRKVLSIDDQRATDIRGCNVMIRSTAGWLFFPMEGLKYILGEVL